MVKRKKDGKLTPAALRELIAKYNIVFKGPIPASRWPKQYSQIFEKVKNIDRIRFDEYHSGDTRDILSVAEQKQRIRDLTRIAGDNRRLCANEDTWRQNTEPQVVARFSAEVIWNCRSRLWISEFQAMPTDTDEAERLRKRRGARNLCRCDAAAREKEDIYDASDILMFSNHAGKRFVHHPLGVLEKLGVPVKPDRVFGLGLTKSFQVYTSAHTNTRHSPYADGKVLYPFLIIEAKSEKGGQGFEAIEAQTAFPIRTCLKLQEDLRKSSGQHIDPLVWFLAYQGDEWRLAAGIVHDSEYQVIDLWLGRVLSQDGALQLFHIVDFICDWARDIYRRDILCCLANGEVNLRDWTPAYTVQSPAPSDGVNATSSWSLPPANSTPPPPPPPIIDLTQIDTLMQDTTIGSLIQPNTSATNDDTQPSVRLQSEARTFESWGKRVTITHCNLILFKFVHVRIPEDHESAVVFLRRENPYGDIQGIAGNVLRLILDKNDHTINLSRNGITKLKSVWLGDEFVPDTEANSVMRVHVTIRSYFQKDDWQIVRELQCLSCSQRAADQLEAIAGLPKPTSKKWIEHVCPCVPSRVESLRRLSGQGFAVAATSSTGSPFSLALQDDGFGHFQFAVNSKSDAMLLDVTSVTHTDTHQESRMAEVSPGRLAPAGLRAVLGKQASCDAMILLKPDDWPESCPRACLLVFKDIDFADGHLLGRLLEQAWATSWVSQVGSSPAPASTDGVLGDTFIKGWVKHLSNTSGH